MTEPDGVRPLGTPARSSRRAQDEFTVSPFARLARTHAFSTAADAMVATALAGTIFFEGATSEARGKVLLYLVLTMAPFALVSPLIGPALDRARSGRRWMIVGSLGLRALMALFMVRDVDSLLFYPEAFTILVLQKGYAVARSAVVPTTVDSDAALVEANSKLSLLSGLMGFLGAAPAALLFKLGGPSWSLMLAVVVFAVGAVVASRLPSEAVAETAADAVEKAELRGVGVLLAASAMGLIRGIVGFLTLLIAFDFRRPSVPNWHFAVVAATSVGGSLVGAALAPRLRRLASEERMLIGVLGVIVAVGFAAVAVGGLFGAAALGLAVGVGASTGKLAFDAIVQRDAPDANRGRSFAKFETRFQVIWVVGAMIGLIEMPARLGFIIVTVVAAFAAASYAIGSLAWKHRSGEARTPTTERAAVIDSRVKESKAAARQGLSRSTAKVRSRLNSRTTARRAAKGGAGPAPIDEPPATLEAPTGWGRPEEPVTEDTPNWKS